MAKVVEPEVIHAGCLLESADATHSMVSHDRANREGERAQQFQGKRLQVFDG